MKVASTKLTNPEWEQLQNVCNSKGMTIAEYLRQLVRTDIAEGKSPQSKEEKQSQEANEKPKDLFQLLKTSPKSNITKNNHSRANVDDDE